MKNKVIIAVLAIVIVLGIFMASVIGFNKSFDYGYTNRIFISFTESFEIADVEQMAKDVFQGAKYKINYIDEFKDGVVLSLNTATEEQISAFEDKLIEKYEKFTDKNSGFMQVIHVPPVKTFDLVKVFIKPIVIVTAAALVFWVIMFRKLGFIKALILPTILLFGINALYVSLITILRIPISEYAIAFLIFVYAMSLIITTCIMKNLARK